MRTPLQLMVRGALPCLAAATLLAGLAAAGEVADRDEQVSLASVRRAGGFQSLTVQGRHAVLLTRFHSLELERDSRQAAFDGVNVWLHGPVTRSWGRLYMLQADVDQTVLPLVNPRRALRAAGCRVVVLDPGHGGQDRGAVGSAWLEKDLNLEVARAVADILGRYRWLEVRLTRVSDRSLTLNDRVRLATAWRADLFVSVHFNAAANDQARGVETFVLAPAGLPVTAAPADAVVSNAGYPGNRHDGANLVLGWLLQQRLLKYTRSADRGVRRARFVVIRDVPCPAALLECGFLSNRAEYRRIATASYRDQLARGVAEGILAYLRAVEQARPAAAVK